MNFGATEIIIVFAVLFLLFGASRLPQLAKSLGQSKKAFREGMREAEEEERIEREVEDQRKITAGAAATPSVSALSDEQLLEEMRRRAANRQN